MFHLYVHLVISSFAVISRLQLVLIFFGVGVGICVRYKKPHHSLNFENQKGRPIMEAENGVQMSCMNNGLSLLIRANEPSYDCEISQTKQSMNAKMKRSIPKKISDNSLGNPHKTVCTMICAAMHFKGTRNQHQTMRNPITWLASNRRIQHRAYSGYDKL